MARKGAAGGDIFAADGRLREDFFTESAISALRQSLGEARRTQWDSLRSPHVFMGLLAEPDLSLRDWARRLGEDLQSILDQFRELFQQHGEKDPAAVVALHREFLSDNAIKLLREARRRALENRRDRATPMDLLITLLTSRDNIVVECFESIGQSAARLTELAVQAEHTSPPR